MNGIETTYSPPQRPNLYFVALGESVGEAVNLHKQMGLLEKVDTQNNTQESWRNVSEHCLVEVARVNELGKMFHFPPDLLHDLKLAAMAHDFYKKKEKAVVESGNYTEESFNLANSEAELHLKKDGFNERTRRLYQAVGHTSLENTKQMLIKARNEGLSEEEIAFLVLHYVDDYTIGSEWDDGTEEVDGKMENGLDRRVRKNASNKRYSLLNTEYEKRNGVSLWEDQKQTGHAVEELLSHLLTVSGNPIRLPLKLPQLVDQRIKIAIQEFYKKMNYV